MSDNVSYFVDVHGDGHPVDLIPIAREIIDTCPFKNDLTPLELAQLAEKDGNGKYIPVDVQDRVSGRRLHVMTYRVISWARAPKRIEQLADPDVRRLLPYLALVADGRICPRAKKMSSRFLDASDLEPLPLKGCWSPQCYCAFQANTPEQAKRRYPNRFKKGSV